MPIATHECNNELQMHVPRSNERVRQRRARRLVAQRCHPSQWSPPHGRGGPIQLTAPRVVQQTRAEFWSRTAGKRGRRSRRRDRRVVPPRTHITTQEDKLETHQRQATDWPEPPAYSPVHYEDREQSGTMPTDDQEPNKMREAPHNATSCDEAEDGEWMPAEEANKASRPVEAHTDEETRGREVCY